MKLFTIGFTKTTAEHFFTRLKGSGARTIVDVRLNNTSQLAGFAKRDDLSYFARTICAMDYRPMLEFAPTKGMFDDYKNGRASWSDYAARFLKLIAERKIERIDRAGLQDACLLCSEDTPHHCHRRLVAEYLKEKWGDVEIEHL